LRAVILQVNPRPSDGIPHSFPSAE
jgi:hypothetical protein